GGYIFRVKAAILHGPRDLRVESSRAPEVRADEVLVRVGVAGLCGTDYRIWSGDRPVAYPRVMGHEFVGRVEAVGPGVTRVAPGDRVAVEPNYSCGTCPRCLEGNRHIGLARTALGGGVDGFFAGPRRGASRSRATAATRRRMRLRTGRSRPRRASSQGARASIA